MLKLMMESDGVQKAGLSAATCTCITAVSVRVRLTRRCHASAGHAFYDNMRVVNVWACWEWAGLTPEKIWTVRCSRKDGCYFCGLAARQADFPGVKTEAGRPVRRCSCRTTCQSH